MTACIAALTLGLFECAPQQKQVTESKDGRYTVVLQPSGELLIYQKGHGEPSSKTRLTGYGHHLRIELNHNASTIVLIDVYDGIQIFDRLGRQLAYKVPKDILTKLELAKTPHRWACHPEGTWVSDPKLSFARDRVHMTIYSGRRIEIPFSAKKDKS